jgi:hypothetical protein
LSFSDWTIGASSEGFHGRIDPSIEQVSMPSSCLLLNPPTEASDSSFISSTIGASSFFSIGKKTLRALNSGTTVLNRTSLFVFGRRPISLLFSSQAIGK